ncbi:MAG: helix-turn-helix domain-containing protein [Acidimicrobiia bacterium]
MARVHLEFTVEPFTEGSPGPHVRAAIAAVESFGLEPDIGPFGTGVEAPAETVGELVAKVTDAALSHGAQSITLTMHKLQRRSPSVQHFLDAVRPAVAAMGGRLIDPAIGTTGDTALSWEGEIVAYVRHAAPTGALQDALPRLINTVERELGAPLHQLSREDKQRAAAWLEAQGAFQLRNAVEDVADAMGVSRVTVYNYLAALRGRS